MEKLNVKRTTKYGVELQEAKEDGSPSYRGTTDKVRNWLSKQVPCTVEIEELEGNIISKVRVLKGMPKEEPIEVERHGQEELPTASDYWDQRQESIIAQTCIKQAIRWIEANNAVNETKVLPTKNNLYTHATMIREIINQLVKEHGGQSNQH